MWFLVPVRVLWRLGCLPARWIRWPPPPHWNRNDTSLSRLPFHDLLVHSMSRSYRFAEASAKPSALPPLATIFSVCRRTRPAHWSRWRSSTMKILKVEMERVSIFCSCTCMGSVAGFAIPSTDLFFCFFLLNQFHPNKRKKNVVYDVRKKLSSAAFQSSV